MTPNRDPYWLIDTAHYGVCKDPVAEEIYDPRFFQIGYIDESTLYNDNGILNIINHLPKYKDSMDYQWNLFISPYFDWDVGCDATFNRKDFLSMIRASTDDNESYISLNTCSISFMILTIFFGIAELVLYID